MRDHADAFHTEQRRAAVLRIIQMTESRGELLLVDAGFLQGADDEWGDRLVELQHHVSDKAVADDHIEWSAVASSSRQVTPFDVADEVEASGRQELMRFLH